MISWSILSPAIRIEWLSTMPPREITATSVVPPPMSTIMQPEGAMIGRRAGAGVEGGIVHGALLDLGHAARYADDDARARYTEAVALVHRADEVVEHALGDGEGGG